MYDSRGQSAQVKRKQAAAKKAMRFGVAQPKRKGEVQEDNWGYATISGGGKGGSGRYFRRRSKGLSQLSPSETSKKRQV